MTSTANKPLDTIRDGRLKATIWENHSENGEFYTIQFSRLYEDENGNLQDSNSFGRNDLLRIARLATLAYDEIDLHRKADLERASA